MLSQLHNVYIGVKMQAIISGDFDNMITWNINGKGESKTHKMANIVSFSLRQL